jgi:hypothetical protein
MPASEMFIERSIIFCFSPSNAKINFISGVTIDAERHSSRIALEKSCVGSSNTHYFDFQATTSSMLGRECSIVSGMIGLQKPGVWWTESTLGVVVFRQVLPQ